MNPMVKQMVDALFHLNMMPTSGEVEKAMELAYKCGYNDGAMQAAQDALAAVTRAGTYIAKELKQ